MRYFMTLCCVTLVSTFVTLDDDMAMNDLNQPNYSYDYDGSDFKMDADIRNNRNLTSTNSTSVKTLNSTGKPTTVNTTNVRTTPLTSTPTTTPTTTTVPTTKRPLEVRRWFDRQAVTQHQSYAPLEESLRSYKSFLSIYNRDMSNFYDSAKRYVRIERILNANNGWKKKADAKVNRKRRHSYNNLLKTKPFCAVLIRYANVVERYENTYSKLRSGHVTMYGQAQMWSKLLRYAKIANVTKELKMITSSDVRKSSFDDIDRYARTLLYPKDLQLLYNQIKTIEQEVVPMTSVVNDTLKYVTDASFVKRFDKLSRREDIRKSYWLPDKVYDIEKFKFCSKSDSDPFVFSLDAINIWREFFLRKVLKMEPRYNVKQFAKTGIKVDRKEVNRILLKVFGSEMMNKDRDRIVSRFENLTGEKIDDMLEKY